eukprot:403348104
MQSFFDPEYTVRKTVSSVMSILIVKGGFHIWPELLGFLTENLLNTDTSIVENSIQAISIIVEDCAQLFENEEYYQVILNMIPNIFRLLDLNQTENVKQHAINTVNILLMTQSPAVCNHLESYAKHLLTMQVDPSPQVRWRIIQGLNAVQELRVDIIMQIFDQVCDLMINALKENDQKIALAATEFWSGIVSQRCNTPQEEELKVQKIFHKLPILLAALFECCRFTEFDRMALMPSKDNDIEFEKKNQSQDNFAEGEEEDYEIGDDEYFTTLRKSSAFTIERYSKIYHDECFFMLLPHLETAMKSQNPDLIEPAILVLGAISDSDGAYGVIKIHLDNLVPYLLEALNSNNELVRSTTLWTLSKFTDWIAQSDRYMEIYINNLCQKMIDNDQNVQEAACAALAVITESAPDKLLPHIQKPLDAFKMVIDIYKGNALVLLLDAIGQMAQSLGENIRNESIISQLMPILNKKYMDIDDESKIIFPLFECFESVVSALGPLSEPFSKPIFERCVNIIQKFMNKVKEDPDSLFTESEYFVGSIDLISFLFSAIGSKAQQLVVQTNFLAMLYELLQLKNNLVKQYVFAMLGDSQKYLGELFKLCLPQFIQVAIDHLIFNDSPEYDKSFMTVCNNACWFLGQAIDSPNSELVRPYIPHIVQRIVSILSASKLNKSLAQNLSVTFGRTGLLESKETAVYLDRVLKQFCMSMKIIKTGAEKNSAFKGICQMIPHNPQAALNAFPYLCFSFVNYKDIPQDLFNIFQGILNSYKNSMESQWEEFMASLPQDLRQQLLTIYNV